MKRFFKILFLIITIVVLFVIGFGYFTSEPLPKAVQGK